MNEMMVERVARSILSGEDWDLTEEIIKLMPQVVREIQHRGGQSTVMGGRIVVRKFVLDPLHAIPLEIRLYEGSYYPGKVLVEATFGPGHPVPVRERQPFDAKAIVDAIAEAFMSLVNYKKEASERTAVSWGNRSYGEYLDAVEAILDKKNVKLTQAMMDFIAECQEEMVSPADCGKSIMRGGWRVHSPSTAASEMLAVSRILLGMDFPTQDSMDKYLKDHPDADKSNHRVVRQEPGRTETHPFNLMQKRKNEQKMDEISRHYGKKPGDLTNDEIVRFNQGKK